MSDAPGEAEAEAIATSLGREVPSRGWSPLARWNTLLTDYELVSPFPQLGRPTFRVAVREGRVALCSGWRIVPGALLGLLRRGWRSVWGDGRMIAGICRRYPGGEATFACEPFFAHEPQAIETAAIGPLVFTPRTPPSPVVISELLHDLDRIRRHA